MITLDQPNPLVQFIGTLLSFDPTTGIVTFQLPELAPSQAEALQKFADRLIQNETKILVLTYDFDDFNEWHNKHIVPQLKAQVRPDATAPKVNRDSDDQ